VTDNNASNMGRVKYHPRRVTPFLKNVTCFSKYRLSIQVIQLQVVREHANCLRRTVAGVAQQNSNRERTLIVTDCYSDVAIHV